MSNDILFTPIQLGGLELKNRIVLAPLTRGRAGPTRIPNSLMATYYRQRSSAGMMISEATLISEQGRGWVDSPGLYSDEMEAAWRSIIDNLQGTDSPLFYQMWHCGRASHSEFHDGTKAVSSSAVKINEDYIHTPNGKQPHETPRPLETDAVAQVVEDYGLAAERAMRAGFSGIEVHAANGYLPNQFLDAKTNLRQDQYGGSLENRFRFLKEIIARVSQVFPMERIGVRLSPNGTFNDMGSPDYQALYDFVIAELNQLKVGYLHVMDGLAFGFHKLGEPYTLDRVRARYDGVIMGNCGYDADSARQAIEAGSADLISFGRPFITNPDFPMRVQNGWPLAPAGSDSLWYGGGEQGYTDYPAYSG